MITRLSLDINMHKMATLSIPILTVLDQSHVSPAPATIGNTSYPLTFFDLVHIRSPIHFLFFYELTLTTTQFIETIVPKLKHSLSITLQHFFPYAGNLIVFPTNKMPEIRYVENDHVEVTFAQCNLDFSDLTGYHPRNCNKFHHLIPQLGQCSRVYDYLKIPVFSLQVTNFPNSGISIGMTIHHSLVDASTQFSFLKAWTSVTRFGNDESFLANGTLPIYERMIKYPNLDESFLKHSKVETLYNEMYQPKLPDSTNKVRATFVLPRSLIDSLKKMVLTQLPTLPYVSSFTVACAYIWCCTAKARDEELLVFVIPLDCRTRLNPPIPATYFGNCIGGSIAVAETALLRGKEGFITAAKLIGENLHKTLNDKDGVVNDKHLNDGLVSGGEKSITTISIAGTPKIKLYDIDFGWGKPKKLERVSLDYGASISIDSGKECEEDMEIGVCLTNEQMEVFVTNFNLGLEPYI